MPNPARKNLKSAVFTQDPSRASYIEQQDQTDLLEKIDETLKNPLKVEVQNQQEIPSFPEEIKMKIEGVEVLTLKGDKGEKGDKGDSPTTEELLGLIKPLIPEPIPGEPGKTPTESELISLIQPLIPAPIPGPQGPAGKSIIGPAGKDGKNAETPKVNELVKEVVKYLIKTKALDISHIKNSEPIISAAGKVNSGSFMFNGTRYKIHELMHGGGSSSGGGSFTILTATGVVDGSNTVFGFSTKPSLIISDNASVAELKYDGTPQWTWNSGTMQATMVVPPAESILAIQ